MTSFLYENSILMDNSQESPVVGNGVSITEADPSGYPLLEGIPFAPQIEMNLGHYLNFAHNFEMIPQQTNFSTSFLKSILASIDSNDEAVSETWLETLIDVIDLLPEEVIREKIFDVALRKSRSDNAQSRKLIARLIGLMASKLNAPLLKDLLLDISVQLCQDQLVSVKQAICRELPAITRAIGQEGTRVLLLTEYVSLCRSDEFEVRLQALVIMCDMMALADKDYRIEVLLPIIKTAYMEELKRPLAILPILAKDFGKIIHLLHEDLTAGTMDLFIEIYRRMSKVGLQRELNAPNTMPDVVLGEWTKSESHCRRQCAFNLPAFILFAGGEESYEVKFHDILTSFLDDPCPDVCIPLAHGFFTICKLIGRKIYLLKDALIKLLRSDLEEVVVGITANIYEIFDVFYLHGMISSPLSYDFWNELIRSVLDADLCLCNTRNWRAHSELLRQLSSLAVHLPQALVVGTIVPILRKRMNEVKALPCRLAAARSLLVCIKHLENTNHESDLCEILIGDFCDNVSSSKRMLFLQTCELALQVLSDSCFKKRLLFHVLSLFTDPVPNVRRRLVELLPAIKSILSLPEDNSRLKRINFILSCLSSNESDRDVRHSMSNAMQLLEQIHLGEQDGKLLMTEQSDSSSSTDNNQTFMSANESLSEAERSFNQLKEHSEGASETIAAKAVSPADISTSSVPIRRPNNCRIPSYIASERRKSTTYAPALPPDSAAIDRLSSMDVTDDEFLIDAGIRIDQRKKKSPHLTGTGQPSPSASRIVSKGNRDASGESKTEPKGQSVVRTRVKTKMRPPRPISGILPPKAVSEPNRETSLSHENLRASFARSAAGRSAVNAAARRSVAGGRRVSSCNSSPGGSGRSSPTNRRTRLISSASTSPERSPCPSPTLEDHPPGETTNATSPSRLGGVAKLASSIPRLANSKLPLLKVWK